MGIISSFLTFLLQDTFLRAKSGYYEYGLWKACVSFVGQSACSDYSDAAITGKLQGARAFMIMVVIASALATISILINLLLPDSNTIKDQATKFAALVAIPLGIIGVALGLSYFSGGNGSLGAAAALGIVAVILNVAGAIVAFTVQ